MQVLDYVWMGSFALIGFVAANALIGGEIQALLTKSPTA